MSRTDSTNGEGAQGSASSTHSGGTTSSGASTQTGAQNAPATPTAPKKRVPVHSYDFEGKVRPDGQPHEHLGSNGIPPRLLTPEETKALTPDQRKVLKSRPDLYEPVSERAYANRVKRDEELAAAPQDVAPEYRVDPVYLQPVQEVEGATDEDADDDTVEDEG
jgi:hypothetical protein